MNTQYLSSIASARENSKRLVEIVFQRRCVSRDISLLKDSSTQFIRTSIDKPISLTDAATWFEHGFRNLKSLSFLYWIGKSVQSFKWDCIRFLTLMPPCFKTLRVIFHVQGILSKTDWDTMWWSDGYVLDVTLKVLVLAQNHTREEAEDMVRRLSPALAGFTTDVQVGLFVYSS